MESTVNDSIVSSREEILSIYGPLRVFANRVIQRFLGLGIPNRLDNWYKPITGIGYEVETRSGPDLRRIAFEMSAHITVVDGYNDVRNIIVGSPGLSDYFCRDGMGIRADPPDEYSLGQRLLSFVYEAATSSYEREQSLSDLDPGFDVAFEKLKGELLSPYLTRQIVALLHRTRIEGGFEIGDGVKIRPASLKERNDYIGRSATIAFGAPAPLDTSIRPIIHSESLLEIRLNGPRTLRWELPAIDTLLEQSLGSLRIDPGVAVPVIATYIMLDSVGYTYGTGVIQRAEPLPQLEWQTISSDSIETARLLLEKFQSSPNRLFVETAVRRLNSGLARLKAEDAFIDYMVGMESMMTDQKQTGEITYKISMRTSAMIGSSLAERAEIKRDMNALYGKRSGVLHGKPNSTDLTADVKRLNSYLRRLIKTLLYLEELFQPNTADMRLLEGFDR
jgi:hypothetical protein